MVGPHMFGYNKRTHILHCLLDIPAAAAAAGLCTLLRGRGKDRRRRMTDQKQWAEKKMKTEEKHIRWYILGAVGEIWMAAGDWLLGLRSRR